MKHASFLLLLLSQVATAQTDVFINEIHYDNSGTDTGEAIEVAGPAGTDLTGWSIVRYNGNGGAAYGSDTLGGTITDLGNGIGVVVINYPSNGLQNGSPDGVALVNSGGTVVQFLSYEGSFAATDGVAAGMTSTDIGISESSGTVVGFSLQLSGTGTDYEDFSWGAAAATFGGANAGQMFDGNGTGGGTGPTTFINELHYDNASTDTGEAIEIAGPAGTDLTGWSLVLYNGNGGAQYNSQELGGVLEDQCTGYGFASWAISGIQNGAPDGAALVDDSGAVVQFLSYEGAFTAIDGPAVGLTSTNIGVSEDSGTAAGQSLQLAGNGTTYDAFTWQFAAANTFGYANAGQTFGDPGADCGGPVEPPTLTSIPTIQGAGSSSPIEGESVVVEATVTGDFQATVGTHGNLRGFFIQDAGDGDPATSDGIFVFDNAGSVDVNPGDLVRVSGVVAEYFGETQINASGGSVEVIGVGTVSPTLISLPAASTVINRDDEVIADLEQYEGMLVTLPQTLTITELFVLDRFGEMTLAEGGRFEQYTQSFVPNSAGAAAHLEDIGSRSLILDDGLTVQNPDPIRYPAPALSTANAVRMGDTVSGLTGNLRFSRGSGGSGDEAFRLEPTVEPVFAQVNSRPDEPADVGGRIKVASFNLLNFFNDLRDGTGECFAGGVPVACRGASNVTEYDRQVQKLVSALGALDADIIGVNELENDYPDGEFSSIAELVDRLNDVGSDNCGQNFDYIRPSGSTLVGDDVIAVGVIYCAASVTPGSSTSVAILDDSQAVDVGFSVPLFTGEATSRSPLAATFDENATGERFTVVVNHFKSKGASTLGGDAGCASDPASNPDCDQQDGAGYWNDRRTQTAEAVLAWLETDPTDSGDDDFIIIGDLNAYLMETPVTTLQDAGYMNLISAGDYSYVFDGQTGTLDYGFVSPNLSNAVTGVDEWHINADEADALDYNLDFGRPAGIFDGDAPYRASDHDPLLFGVDLPDTTPPEISCNAPGSLDTRDHGASFVATAADAFDDSPDVEVIAFDCERPGLFGMSTPGLCSADTNGAAITLVQLGGAGNEITWTVRASDNAGNAAEKECSVQVVQTGNQ